MEPRVLKALGLFWRVSLSPFWDLPDYFEAAGMLGILCAFHFVRFSPGGVGSEMFFFGVCSYMVIIFILKDF